MNKTGNKAEIQTNSASGKLYLPIVLEKIKINMDSSNINGTVRVEEGIDLYADSSNASLKVLDLRDSDNTLTIDSSNINIDLRYKEHSGTSRIRVKVDSSTLRLNIFVPETTKIKATLYGSYGFIEINGKKTKEYIDEDYDMSSSRLELVVEADSSLVKVNIQKR